jgi:DNA-binding NarL/FixJ family response regulator
LETTLTRVLVVDDSEVWRRFFSSTLQKQPEYQVIGELSDGLVAVQQAQQLQPDLILMDIGLPTLNGIEATRRIREVSPRSRILCVSENRSAEIAEEALHIGAGGYVVKSKAGSEFLPAVKAVLQGKQFVGTGFSRNLNRSTDAHPVSIKHCHEIAFYADDGSLVDGYARFTNPL